MSNEKEWRLALDQLGPEFVRQHLQDTAGTKSDSPDPIVFNDAHTAHPSRKFVSAWYVDQHRRATRRADRQNVLVWVAAMAAVIGAVAGVVGLFSSG